MLYYFDLTPSQRHWVDLVEAVFPEDREAGEISYKRLNEIHNHFVSLRGRDGRYKCSKPLWLITNNAISRGVYKFPSSKSIEIEQEEVLDSDLEIRYREELEKLDIPFKKAK
jgi:hypothetical protein